MARSNMHTCNPFCAGRTHTDYITTARMSEADVRSLIPFLRAPGAVVEFVEPGAESDRALRGEPAPLDERVASLPESSRSTWVVWWRSALAPALLPQSS